MSNEPKPTPEAPPEEWEEVAPEDSEEDGVVINPYMDPDMPGGVPLLPGHPDQPMPPIIEDHLPDEEHDEPRPPLREPAELPDSLREAPGPYDVPLEEWDEEVLEDLPEEEQGEPVPPS